jgi:hypothetical protein
MCLEHSPLNKTAFVVSTDRSTPQTLYRWTATWAMTLLFIARIYFAGAYYIVTYALGIYLLSQCKRSERATSSHAMHVLRYK